MVTQLFTIVFTDNTQLWATMQNGFVCYGTLGKGINVLVKPVFEKTDSKVVCFFAQEYSDSSQYVKQFTDHITEKSNTLAQHLQYK